MMSTTDNFEVTATGASETPVPAVGSGSSQKSSASSQNPEMRVSGQAPISGNITAETVVPPGTQRNQASDRDLIANMKSYADIMRKVKMHVQLKELDLKPITRVTKSGAILLKVQDDKEADKLASALNAAVRQIALIKKPSGTTPILILDLAVWHSTEDVESAVRSAVPELLRTKVVVRVNPGGGRVGRFDTPLPAAIKLAELGRLDINWSRCRVKLLETKEKTCYRCQNRGHLAEGCTADEAKKRCFRCNSIDHLAIACMVKTKHSER